MKDPKATFELVGIIAVVFGLFFVGYELRQNQLGLQAQTRATVAQIDIESTRSFREDEDLLRLRVERSPSIESIDELRWNFWLREMARTAEHQFFQYRIGTFDQAEFEGVRTMWIQIFSEPEALEWWEAQKYQFSATFREELDELLGHDPADA